MTEQRGEMDPTKSRTRTATRTSPRTLPRTLGPASYFPAIEKRYGAPVQHWIDLLATCPLDRHGEQVAWLKAEYGLGHGHANALVAHFRAL